MSGGGKEAATQARGSEGGNTRGNKKSFIFPRPYKKWPAATSSSRARKMWRTRTQESTVVGNGEEDSHLNQVYGEEEGVKKTDRPPWKNAGGKCTARGKLGVINNWAEQPGGTRLHGVSTGREDRTRRNSQGAVPSSPSRNGPGGRNQIKKNPQTL